MPIQHTMTKPGLRLVAALALLCLVLSAQAGQLIDAYVEHKDGHYLLNLEMLVEAPLNNVQRVMLDTEHLSDLNEIIKQSHLLKSNESQQWIYLETQSCIWFFCRTIKQTQLVTEMTGGYITAVILPEESDLEYGKVLWRLQSQGNQTRISYSADIVPNFWVPPFIGTWLVRNQLLEECQKTIEGIERRARQL